MVDKAPHRTGAGTANELSAVGHAPAGARLLTGGLSALFLLLALGDLVWSLKERAMPDLFKTQLRDYSDNPLLLNILFGAVPALIAIAIGPAIGSWSDRTRTRIGRRIPFLIACTPLMSATIIGLAYSQYIADYLWHVSGTARFSRDQFIVSWMCACWTLYELFTIVTNALFVALINDTVPRPILGRFFGVFRIISLGVGIVFFYIIFSNELPDLIRPVCVMIALAYLIGFVTISIGIREPPYPPADRAPALGSHEIGPGRLGLNGLTMFAFVTLAIGNICALPVNINSYAAISQFGADRTSYGHAVAVAYSISIVLAFPLGWLADRYHPLRVGFVVLFGYSFSMLAAFFLVSDRDSFLTWLVVHSVLAGAFVTATASLLPALLPKAHFSALAALSNSITALLTVAFTVFLGNLLDGNGRDLRLIFLVAGAIGSAGVVCWHILLRSYRKEIGSAS